MSMFDAFCEDGTHSSRDARLASAVARSYGETGAALRAKVMGWMNRPPGVALGIGQPQAELRDTFGVDSGRARYIASRYVKMAASNQIIRPIAHITSATCRGWR